MQKQSILSQEEIQGHILLTDDEAHLRAALTVVFEENAKKGGSGLETKIKGFCGLMKGRETPNSFIELQTVTEGEISLISLLLMKLP